MRNIFIGYDHRQQLSYNVLSSSILRHATEPVSINPLKLDTLPIKRQGLTPFTFSRFLVPWLMDGKGWGLFMDSDMLCLADICELFRMVERDKEPKAVYVAKVPARFEWAAMMMFNCAHPANARLTPTFIEQGERLHTIQWLDDELIGELPREYCHTVFYDLPRTDAKIVHYTAGIPIFPETTGCEYTQEYAQELQQMGSIALWEELMGRSVHTKRVREFMAQRDGGVNSVAAMLGGQQQAASFPR
jgi:hypothetical protein